MKVSNDIAKEMEGSRFNFKRVGSFNIRCNKLNELKGLSYIKSPKWLGYKYVVINQKNIDDRCFQYAFGLTQQHKEIKNQ